MPFRGRERLKTGGRTSLTRWYVRSWQMSSHMKWWTSVDSHASYTTTNSSSSHQKQAFPCVWVSAKYGTDVPVPLQLSLLPGGDSETMPQKDSGLVITQHQARNTSLGWINRKLWLLLWTSTRASTEDRWRLQVMCSGHGYLQDCMHLAEG